CGESLTEGVHALEPVVGLYRHGLENNGFDHRWEVGSTLPWWFGFPLDMLKRDLNGIFANVGFGAGKQFVHDNSYTVDVCAGVDGAPTHLFWGHIRRCAHARTALGQTGVSGTDTSRETEIDDFDEVVLIDEDIVGFQIPVHN